MQFFNTLAARAIPFLPRAAIHRISRRYIAGATLEEAVERVQQLDEQGFLVTLDVLGEGASSLKEAERTADEYVAALAAIERRGLQTGISVKPSGLGLMLDIAHCERLIEHILNAAARHQSFVCIDMEDVNCTQIEIDLYTRLRAHHTNVGLALQAYLRRTYEDVDVLVHQRSALRICKGIYLEDKQHLVNDAWRDRRAINTHFVNHVQRCFDGGNFVAIATHDTELVDQIIALARRSGVPGTNFEFQMLLGVCEPLRDRLRQMGFSVRLYLPYGRDCYAYSMRRLQENPRIAGHVMRATFGR